MNARVAEDIERYYLAVCVRNGKSRRCILTSGTAHHKPENIMLRDLQFGWLAKSSFFSLFLSLSVSVTSSLHYCQWRANTSANIRPGRTARQKVRRRVTRNKNAVNFHFLPRTSHCVIVLCRRRRDFSLIYVYCMYIYTLQNPDGRE